MSQRTKWFLGTMLATTAFSASGYWARRSPIFLYIWAGIEALGWTGSFLAMLVTEGGYGTESSFGPNPLTGARWKPMPRLGGAMMGFMAGTALVFVAALPIFVSALDNMGY